MNRQEFVEKAKEVIYELAGKPDEISNQEQFNKVIFFGIVFDKLEAKLFGEEADTHRNT